MIAKPDADNVVHDGTSPDPEEMDLLESDELSEVPVPQKVERDFGIGGDEPGEGLDREKVNLDDGVPDRHDQEDLAHGDEGIDDPASMRKPGEA